MTASIKKSWPLLVAALFAVVVLWLSRGLTVDTWDGIQAVENALVAAKARTPSDWGGPQVVRPPFGWLLASPLVAWRYAAAGPLAALRLFQSLMVLAVAALLAVSHRINGRLASERAAAAALLAMALNPLLIEFAPFVSMDLIAPLALLPFLWAAVRYDESPSLGRYAALLGAYVAAFLTKYHLGVAILVPLAYPLVDPRRRGDLLGRLRTFILNPVWLMPALCWLATVAFWTALKIWTWQDGHIFAWEEFLKSHEMLFNALIDNVGGSATGHLAMIAPPSRFYYIEVLAYQLGWPLLAFAALGWASWWRSRDPLRLHAALALGCLFGFLVFFLYRPYAHYAFTIAPLVYAAVAQGLDVGFGRLRTARGRAWTAGAVILLSPWDHAADSIRYLRSDPPIRSSVISRLAAAVEAASAPGQCVGWVEGEMALPPSGLRYEPWPLLFGRQTFSYFTTRHVALPEMRERCEPKIFVVPRDWPQSFRQPPRWDSPALARIYREPEHALVAEIGAD